MLATLLHDLLPHLAAVLAEALVRPTQMAVEQEVALWPVAGVGSASTRRLLFREAGDAPDGYAPAETEATTLAAVEARLALC